MYIPPNRTTNIEKIAFINNLIMEIFADLDGPAILCGDLNLPFNKNDPHIQCFFNFISHIGFYNHITNPTHLQNIIDLVLTNENNLVTDINTQSPFGNSDHLCIVFKILCPSKLSSPINHTYKYDFKRGNYEGLNNFFSTVNWKMLFENSKDLNFIYTKFLEMVNLGLQNFIPYLSTKSKPKLPTHISNLLKYKNKLYKDIKYPKVLTKYMTTSKKIDKELKRYHVNLENKIIKSPINNLYKHIKNNFNSKTSLSFITVNENHITNSQEIANFLQNHFSNIYFDAAPAEPLAKTNREPIFDYGLIFLTNNQIYNCLKKLPLKINNSPDGIPNYVLKKCSLTLTEPIGYILRTSYFTGNIPTIWKMAYLIPLQKTEKNREISNFRPISLTCSLAKIAEQFVYDELYGFISNFDILPSFQHGFRKNKSVYSSLIESIDDWSKALDNKLNADIIFFDISKAFDTIEHARLLIKLENMGITGDLLMWLKNFLSNRQFRVLVNGKFSNIEPALINRGVPQGTLLGPLIFNLYISDLMENFMDKNITIKAYADDHKAYHIYKYFPKENTLQMFCNYFNNWCSENGLKLSENKTLILYVGKSNPRKPYYIGDTVIKEAIGSVRDLGIMVTQDLNWKIHTDL